MYIISPLAIKQNKILSFPMNHKLLHYIGPQMVDKFGLDKRLTYVMRGSIIYNICVELFTISHKKFHLKYAIPRSQQYIFEMIRKNLNRSNPLDFQPFPGIDLSCCPKENNEDFIHVKIKDLDSISDQLPFLLPTMDNFGDMISFTGGPYKYNQGQKYLVALRKLELQEKKESEFGYLNQEEYFRDCRVWPQETMLHIKHIEDGGDFWAANEEEYGRFPEGGAILIGM